MGIICGSALQQGALSQIYHRDVVEQPMRWLSEPRRRQFMALYEFVRDCNIPLPELALRFVLSNPDVTSVLTGVYTVEQLERNVESAAKGPLPPEILAKIEEIYQMVPFRPYGEPFVMVFKQLTEQQASKKKESDEFAKNERKR